MHLLIFILLNPFKSEFIIVIFIYDKQRIAVALIANEDDLKWVGNEKNIVLSLEQFHGYLPSKTIGLGTLSHSSDI